MRRRDTVKYAAVLVAVFGTIICAAEFQDTGAQPVPMQPHVVSITTTPSCSPSGLDTAAALERAREDARRVQHKVMDNASRSATSWLAP
jgi:hypothetical protein